ncbi:hypothetical protein ACIQJX_34945 [Streptomyces griseoviridis]
MKISKYAKAITAGLVGGAAALSTAAADGIITGAEIWGIAGAVLAGLGITWAVPNRPSGGV